MSESPVVPKFPPRPSEPPKFPPRPSEPGALILSSLPEELPAALRTPPVAEPRKPRRVRGPVLGAAALVVLLAVAGLVWWQVESESPAPAPPPAPAPEFEFARAPETAEAALDSDCATHAYGETRKFLTETPCAQLTRALFTTATWDGRTVFTSVAVVRMRTAEDAARLGDLVSADGTGSVNDLLRDQVATVPGLPRLSRGGFAATVDGREVVVAESDTASPVPDPLAHEAEMKRVSTEALALGIGLS
ncbi:hypothetical protein ACTG9Q_26605 [Actinokineospora sp. 24-640]